MQTHSASLLQSLVALFLPILIVGGLYVLAVYNAYRRKKNGMLTIQERTVLAQEKTAAEMKRIADLLEKKLR
jgi:hypothetical protein